MNIKKDPRSLPIRLWEFQKERAPIFVMLVMASLTVGVFATFAHTTLRNFAVAVAIICLYLTQTRASDEKKDFEHDNQFHKDRPVQRGVVTLEELRIVNQIAIYAQLLLYASFLDLRIFVYGLFSQGYAILTRKEFFVREWIRQHFFTYYFLHYIQLVILNLAILNIIKPSVPYWQLITFVMLNIISVEVGRKMFAKEDDTTDDTFSAQLGHKGSAIVLSLVAIAITLNAYYFIHQHAGRTLLIIAPVLTMGLVINNAYHYAIEPNRSNAKYVEYAAALLVLGSMLSVIFGA